MKLLIFWTETKFDWFEVVFWIALGGVAFIVVGWFISHEEISRVLIIAGWVLIVPFLLHANLLAIWHWKKRYRGDHSKLWGALMVLETTGWFRMVYLIKHVVPDRRNKGRYFRTVIRETPTTQGSV
ncbi:MAG: hypothetical protein LAO20_07225 [Acidobacteriia bacterium]|nr:hypothetical protein [Terriglobia bacterium]